MPDARSGSSRGRVKNRKWGANAGTTGLLTGRRSVFGVDDPFVATCFGGLRMMSVAHEAQHRDRESDWPLFLTRYDTDGAPNQPPPLPHGPVIARARRIWFETPKLRLWTAAVFFASGAAGLAATAHSPKVAGLTLPHIEIVRTKATAIVPSIGQIEQRLNFSGHLPSHLQGTESVSELAAAMTNDPVDNAVIDTAAAEVADPVALLILRNLPENTSFSTGAPAGKGEWVMAAGDGDIDQLATILGVEFEQPVMADVEMMSRSGLSLGTLRLQLQKETDEKVAETVSTPHVAAFATEVEKPEVKPAKPAARSTYTQVSKARKVARAEAREKRRAKRIMDAWKAKKPEPSSDEGTDTGVAAGTATAHAGEEAEVKKGPISKLFTWLKGDTSKTPQDQEEENSPPSGLGMFPPK